MNDVYQRLIRCFSAVFPAMSEEQIRTATPDNSEEWDSLASLMLARTIEEEFGIEADLSMMENLNSFESARTYIAGRATSNRV